MRNLLGLLLGAQAARRGYGARRTGYGYGRSRRAAAPGFFNSPLGRMALGGLAAYGARRWYGRGRGPGAGMGSGFGGASTATPGY
jgi:hypothetical protein